MPKFDLAIIGGGPGGCQAAISGQLRGLKTVLIEKKELGGVCLNQGCIPTKTLLSIAKFFDRVKKANSFGIALPSYSYDFRTMQTRKDEVVTGLHQAMADQLKRAGVRVLKGTGRLINGNKVQVTTKDYVDEIEARSIIISTGSRPKAFPNVPFDGRLFLSSDDILNLSRVPERLIVMGGGVTGVEFASLFHSLGTQVTIVELLDRLIPAEDSELGKRLETSFKRRGISVHTGAKVTGIAKAGSSVSVQLQSGEKIQGDHVLIAIGRLRNTEDLGLEKAGVERTGDAVRVDDYLETTAKNVYAVGDVTTLPQLAHVASFGGQLVVENLVSPEGKRPFPKHAIPNCIFCDPAVASVGWSRAEAEHEGRSVKEVKLPLSAQGKAHVERELEGFVKLLADLRDGTVIGGCVMGGEASEVIGVLTLAVSARMKIDELAHTIFAHPTYHEIIGDAARLGILTPSVFSDR